MPCFHSRPWIHRACTQGSVHFYSYSMPPYEKHVRYKIRTCQLVKFKLTQSLDTALTLSVRTQGHEDRCLENAVLLTSTADLHCEYVRCVGRLIISPVSVADWLPLPPFRAISDRKCSRNIRETRDVVRVGGQN